MTPIHSRRVMLSGSAALLTGVTAMLAAPAVAESPDAELIRLCGEIDALEDKINGYRGDTVQLENEQNALAQPFQDAQEPLIDRICGMTATTLEGLRARAQTIVKWAPDLLDSPKDTSDMMVSALLQDLIAGVPT